MGTTILAKNILQESSKPNGDTFYRYLDNSNVWVYTQII